MAAQITTPIGSRAFELIRHQIGAILADELPSQATLNSDSNLNAEVFVERFKPVGDEEVPVVIIGFSDLAPGLKTASSTDGNMTFLIDCYEKAKSTDSEKQADKTATIKLQRLIGVIYGILSHHKYRTLGFAAPFIEHTEIKDIKIAQPKNAKDASSVVMGRIEFIVRAPDKNTASDPVMIDGYSTQALLDLTDLGYTYGNYTLPPVPPVCADVEILLNGTKIVDAESGATVDIPVVYTNGDIAPGVWDGSKYVVPLGVCADATEILKNSNGDILHTDIISSGGINERTLIDSSNTFNGSSVSGVLAEGSKNIIVQTDEGTPVQVGTPIVDTVDELRIEVPGVKKVTFLRPPSSTEISYALYDAGWRQSNGHIPTLTTNNFVQSLDPTTPWKILHDDSEITGITEHLYRFVGINGGYTYRENDDATTVYKDKDGNISNEIDVMTKDGDRVMIDRLTGIMIAYRNTLETGGGKSPANFYSDMWTTEAIAGYTGNWFAMSEEEMVTTFVNGTIKNSLYNVWRQAPFFLPGSNLTSSAFLTNPVGTITLISMSLVHDPQPWSRLQLTATGRFYVPCRTFEGWPLY